MFEAECPSCNATYQVDERRVPDQGLKMRCPKCGESFQVTAPGRSDPPVLGAVLGLSAAQDEKPPTAKKPRHKPTMLGVPARGPAPKPAPPRPGSRTAGDRKTMMGVAPAAKPLELADLEEGDSGASDMSFDLEGPSGGDDLPAIRSSAGSGIELPSLVPSDPPFGTMPPDSDELDLSGGSDELPGLVGNTPQATELELPSLSNDLPSPRESAGLPSPPRADLPGRIDPGLPGTVDAGLPDLGGDLPDLDPVGHEMDALPLSGAGAEHSLVSGSDPAELDPSDLQSDAPPSWGQPASLDDELGASADDIFGEGPTTAPESAHATGAPGTSFGEVHLGGASDEGELDEFDAFPTDDSGSAAGEAGGYGDVALEGGGGDFDLGADLDRPQAPGGGDLPRGPAAAASAAVELPRRTEKDDKVGRKKKKRKASGLSKGARIAIAGVLLLAVAGGALAAFVPDVGPYGVYWVIDTIRADEYQQKLAVDVRAAQARLGLDTTTEVRHAFRDVAAGRSLAPRHQPRLAYAAHLGFLHKLRFGEDSDASAKAAAFLEQLSEADSSVQYLSLARLTRDAAGEKPGLAVARAPQVLARGVEFAVVIGEAALRTGDTKTAEKAWQSVLSEEDTARAHYGYARTLLQQNDDNRKVLEQIDAALAKNPAHTGAILTQAEFFLGQRDKDEQILTSLTELVAGNRVSVGERGRALTILGRLHLRRARLKKAEERFIEALSLDPSNSDAQKGLGQVFFQSGRYSEALTRFEGALRASPGDLGASLGVVRSKLRLEQLDDAVKILDQLVQSHADSAAVAYWVGRGKEAVGDKEEAQKSYEKAIKSQDDVPELVLSHIALTRLLSQNGRFDEANAVILQAKKRFPEDPAVYQALGELSASSGHFEEAVKHFDKALTLDPKNLGLEFERGVALRQARRFDEAAAAFDQVEKESPEYPGLALERGNLFEASGESEKALAAYESALAAAPDDVDLQLRVGCGKASAGQAKEAIQILKPVLEQRQNSAEVNFCFGLAQLNAKDFHEARRYLKRAVSRDPTRAKHHLYVGWVALEMNDLPLARLSLDKAIELDQTLADAYWKRGELRVRQKAVRDALADLDKVLELSPSRFEAHAQKALAYIELGKEQEAMAAFEQAVQGQGLDPYWRYKYGELLLANRRPVEAREQLQLAVEGIDDESTPVWGPNAHRLLAMAIGNKKEAIAHWKAYIDSKQGDTQDPYLREAVQAVNRIVKSQGYD